MSGFLIVGATGGIGAEVSRRLRERGELVLLAARDEERLSALASELDAPFAAMDVTVAGDVDRAFAQTAEHFGGVAGVVNCVGSMLLKPAHITTDAEWSATIAANLTSAFHVVRAGAKAMMQAGGAIVLMSSAAARTGLANHEAIAAAKAGIIGLTLSAAASYAARAIRVNCVAPGMVRTPLTSRITGSEKALAASTAMHALQRIGEPGDVAAAILWLLDRENTWTTGQVIGVDGGLSTVRSRGA